jgi:hypothetical protein
MSLTKFIKNGGYRYPDFDPNAYGDHKVATDATDNAADGADFLLAKHSNNGNVAFSLDTSSGLRRVQGNVTHPSSYPGPMAPVGTDDAGEIADGWARGTHSHPHTDPAVEGSYLFPSHKTDPLLRPTARAMLPHGEAILEFTQISGVSTWQFVGAAGQLYGMDSSYNNTITFVDGDLCFIYNPIPYGTDAIHFGLYEVLDCGLHWVPTPGHPETPMQVLTQPVIRRHPTCNTPDGLCNGMFFQVEAGAYYENEYFTLTTEDPIVVDTTELAFTHSASKTFDNRQLLLTAQQLVTLEPDGGDIYSTATVGTGTFPLSVANFDTPQGSPGISSIPAGLWTWEVEWAQVSVFPSTGEIKLQCVIQEWTVDVDGLPDTLVETIITGTSAPITNTTAGPIASFQANLAAAYTFNPLNVIVAIYSVVNSSTETITLTIRYSSDTRGTRIKVPFTFAVSGTLDHSVLSNRNLPNQHQLLSLEPVGMLLGSLSSGPTTDANGCATLPDGNACLISGTGNFTGMAVHTSNGRTISPGTVVFLTIASARTIVHNSGGLSTNCVPFHLPWPDGFDSPPNLSFQQGLGKIIAVLSASSASWDVFGVIT